MGASSGDGQTGKPAARRRPRPLTAWKPVLVVIFAAAIAFLALRTSPYLQYVPWMPREIGVWADSNGILRNIVAFLVLGLASFLLLGRQVWQVAAVAIFAAAIEIAQLWIPGRVFDWRDIVASVAGVLLAWPLACLSAWAWRRRSRQDEQVSGFRNADDSHG